MSSQPGDPDLRAQLRALRRLRDPRRRAAAATALLEQLSELERQVSAIRDDAVRRLRQAGGSYGSIATVSGLTRSRVVQLLQRVDGESPDPALPQRNGHRGRPPAGAGLVEDVVEVGLEGGR